MPDKTIFQRIIDREVPADVVFEDELCLAFRDISPQAPTHLLVVPKRPIRSLAELSDEDVPLVGHVFQVIRKLAQELHLDGGYRVVVNCGPDAGQSVDHLHFHVLAGRLLRWPPG